MRQILSKLKRTRARIRFLYTKFVHVENCRKEIRLWHGSLLSEILTLAKIKLEGFTLKMVLRTGVDVLSTQSGETRKKTYYVAQISSNKQALSDVLPSFFFFQTDLPLLPFFLSSGYITRSFPNPCFSLDKNVCSFIHVRLETEKIILVRIRKLLRDSFCVDEMNFSF